MEKNDHRALQGCWGSPNKHISESWRKVCLLQSELLRLLPLLSCFTSTPSLTIPLGIPVPCSSMWPTLLHTGDIWTDELTGDTHVSVFWPLSVSSWQYWVLLSGLPDSLKSRSWLWVYFCSQWPWDATCQTGRTLLRAVGKADSASWPFPGVETGRQQGAPFHGALPAARRDAELTVDSPVSFHPVKRAFSGLGLIV